MPEQPTERVITLPWHEGELALQAHAGMAERMAAIGPRNIRDYMTEQHQAFFPLLPFIVLGTVDGAGAAWATIKAGAPGFVQATDARHLAIALPPDGADPAEAGLAGGNAVGVLGIELPTRRRNRVNGRVTRRAPDGFSIEVEQAFGNCPSYISRRQPHFTPAAPQAAPSVTDRLDTRARDLIARADTFFVASYVDLDGRGRQVDVSHRGGHQGFVQFGQDGLLTIPDYRGNKFFNTLGNIAINPRAGLAFFDPERGDLLQISGRAAVLLEEAAARRHEGAERVWTVMPERVVFRPGALPLRFDLVERPERVSAG